jgi:hypothetical protein
MLIEPEDDSEEHFVDVAEDGTKPESSKAANSERDYDGKKREPQFAHAENSCLWDLVRLPLVFRYACLCLAGSSRDVDMSDMYQ